MYSHAEKGYSKKDYFGLTVAKKKSMMNYLFSSFYVADVDRKVLRLIEFYKYYLIIQVLFNNTSKMLS